MNLLEALFWFGFADAEGLYERLLTWPPAAYRALTNRLSAFMWYSALFLAAGLATSYFLERRDILTYIGIAYLLIVAIIANSARTLHAAGLLVGVDLALDIVRSLKPLSRERLGQLATLNIEWKRLQAFATLQLVGRALLYIVLFECLVFIGFCVVPIWVHPELLGPLAFLGAAYGMLSTPWGMHSAFARFRKGLLLAILGMVGYYAWGGYGNQTVVALRNGASWISGIDPWTGMVVAVITLVMIMGLAYKGGANGGH